MSGSSDDLPRDYDVIVLGTGMTESIVAAALSRIGQKVLHLDRNDYYSGDWGTFHFKGIREWAENFQDPPGNACLTAKEVDLTQILKEGERAAKLKINSDSIHNVVQQTYVQDTLQETGTQATGEYCGQMSSSDKELDNMDAGTRVTKTKEVEEHSSQKSSEEKELENVDTGSDQTRSEEVPKELSDQDTKQENCKLAEAKESDEAERDDSQVANVPSELSGNVDTPSLTEWSVDKLDKEFRKFNIDLHPRVLFSRGPMVELLISSDIAKYCEFRTITRVLTILNGKLEQVPCSRSDVFSSKQVSMIEKRMLMKFLTFCLEYEKQPEDYADFENKTFQQYLVSKKLTKTVCHFVQHSIAMVPDTSSTLEGLKATKKFIQSLGRYGNTAFLWPLYGSGELPQCFCRMCAVFGGTYCLRRTGTDLIIDGDNKCQGIIDTEGVRLNAKWVIAESSYLEAEYQQNGDQSRSISRGILLTDRSILHDGQKHISLMSIPASEEQSMTAVLELSPSSLACPEGIYIVHLSCRGKKTAEEDFKNVTELLFQNVSSDGDAETTKPKILWSLFFNQRDTSDSATHSSVPENLFVVGGPDLALDFDYSIEKAKAVFNQICPGEEFLPKAPNPEDIIFDDGCAASGGESGFEPQQTDDDKSTNTSSQETEEKNVQTANDDSADPTHGEGQENLNKGD